MRKDDIERLWELEVDKSKRIHQRMIDKDELFLTALDYNDEVIILRSKIKDISETGIIVVTNPDRAEKNGELLELYDILSLKMVIFTLDLSEDEIIELLDIEEEPEDEDFIVD